MVFLWFMVKRKRENVISLLKKDISLKKKNNNNILFLNYVYIKFED